MTRGVRSAERRESAPSPRPRPSVGLPDAWWPIAFGEEVGQHPQAFRLGSRDLAVYRDLRGVVRAVDDACPHRRLPLSMGRLTEDGYLQCPYHGWCFDGETGQCAAIPNLSKDERVPRSIKVAAFSTAENVADALGWNLRAPSLAPRVGPPTGEEPDDGTAMFDARLSDGLVLVWTGAEAPEADGLPPAPAEVAPGPKFSGKIEIRAPHADVCDAVLWNPGALLGLGWLIGAGDEINDPVIEETAATITVRRDRYALDLPRASTYGSLSRRVVTGTTTMALDSGLTWIDVPSTGRAPGTRMVLALTPVSPYRTVLRWQGVLRGPAPANRLRQVLAASWRIGRRAAGRAESIVDASEAGADKGMERLRSLRALRAECHSDSRRGD